MFLREFSVFFYCFCTVNSILDMAHLNETLYLNCCEKLFCDFDQLQIEVV